MTARLLTFDLMRTIAILIIIFHHLPNYCFNFYNLNHFNIKINLSEINELNRYFGIGLFIFMSGYLVDFKKRFHLNLVHIKSFILKKILRIFPLYYLSLIMFIFQYNMFDLFKIIVHILGLQLIFASKDFKILPTLWFIGLILIYYGIFMIYKIGVLSCHKVVNFLCLWIIILFPFIVWFINKKIQIMDIRLVLYYGVFWFGFYCSNSNFLEKLNRFIAWTLFPCFILFYCFLINKLNINSIENFDFLSKIIVINIMLFCFILFVYNMCNNLSNKIKPSNFIVKISYSSYCIYLFHRPIFYLIQDFSQKIMMINNANLLALILVFLGIPCIIAFSLSLQTLYDKYS